MKRYTLEYGRAPHCARSDTVRFARARRVKRIFRAVGWYATIK